MEEKKLGMGWYEFQRYFTYGFGRIPFLLLAGLFFIIALPEMDIYLFLVSAIFFAYFAFFFIVHRHLENYSDKAGTIITYQHLIFGVIALINVFLAFSVAPEEVGENLWSAAVNFFWYFVNRFYYKNRAHIFVNKCSFWGKKTESPVPVCPDYTSEQPKYKFCRKCGEKLLIEDKFCPKCGTEVIEMEEI
ncbi:MAG: zinc-ribbon domain-containing protein [Oscillospiraceae bacterium]|nr:zinc-ribbon domain-containing protein [Oscillospiraceae bacterium]